MWKRISVRDGTTLSSMIVWYMIEGSKEGDKIHIFVKNQTPID